jgi:hypothetical protein
MVDSPSLSIPCPAFKRDIIDSLDLFHRAVLEIMEERGEIVIVPGVPAGSTGNAVESGKN